MNAGGAGAQFKCRPAGASRRGAPHRADTALGRPGGLTANNSLTSELSRALSRLRSRPSTLWRSRCPPNLGPPTSGRFCSRRLRPVWPKAASTAGTSRLSRRPSDASSRSGTERCRLPPLEDAPELAVAPAFPPRMSPRMRLGQLHRKFKAVQVAQTSCICGRSTYRCHDKLIDRSCTSIRSVAAASSRSWDAARQRASGCSKHGLQDHARHRDREHGRSLRGPGRPVPPRARGTGPRRSCREGCSRAPDHADSYDSPLRRR